MGLSISNNYCVSTITGKLSLDAIFQEREVLNVNIVKAINAASHEAWGIRCLRYEIRDIEVCLLVH